MNPRLASEGSSRLLSELPELRELTGKEIETLMVGAYLIGIGHSGDAELLNELNASVGP